MKFTKIIFLSFSFIIILPLIAAAQKPECGIDRELLSNKVILSISADENELFAFQVLKKNFELSRLENEDKPELFVAYAGDFKTNEKGTAEVEMVLRETDEYTIYLKSADDGDILSYSFYFLEYDDYESIITDLNSAISAGDKTGFYEKLFNRNDNGVDNLKALGFDNGLIESVDRKKVSDMYFYECSDTINKDEYKKNIDVFNGVTAVAALNENGSNAPANILSYIDGIVSDDARLYGFVKKHIKDENAGAYFTSKLLNKNINNLTELVSESKKAIILTAVKYPDGNTNIKAVFEEYKDILGIDSVSGNVDVYRSIGGKDYNDIGALMLAYNAALTQKAPGSGGTGGGGGGGGGGRKTSAVNIVLPETAPDTKKSEALKIKFADIDSLDFEYESVSRLYEMGIISGYSEYEFKPDNSVKREEFVKMLVCAMGFENEQYEAGKFTDTKGQWCEKYVCIAYKKGLINGVGSGLFGKGSEITRQDMAVMIYNAMLLGGYEPKNSENTFSDKENFADYAYKPIAELSSEGVINGMGSNLYRPVESATRAQAAVIIDKALSYLR